WLVGSALRCVRRVSVCLTERRPVHLARALALELSGVLADSESVGPVWHLTHACLRIEIEPILDLNPSVFDSEHEGAHPLTRGCLQGSDERISPALGRRIVAEIRITVRHEKDEACAWAFIGQEHVRSLLNRERRRRLPLF